MKYLIYLILVVWIGRALIRTVRTMKAGGEGSAEANTAQGSSPEARPETIEFDAADTVALLESDRQAAVQRVAEALNVKYWPSGLSEFVMEHLAGSFDPTVNRVLVDAITAPKPHNPEPSMRMLMAVGLSKDSVDRMLQILTQTDRVILLPREFKWSVEGLSLAQAIEEFKAIGMLVEPTKEQLEYVDGNYEPGAERPESEVLESLLYTSPCALDAQRYKPGKDITYEEFFEFVFEHCENIELEDMDTTFDAERHVHSRVELTLNGETYARDYDGHNFLDVEWAADLVNELFAELGETVRCIDPVIVPDFYALYVIDPAIALPLLEKYHMSYCDNFDREAVRQPRAVSRWAEAEKRVLIRYAEQQAGDA